jgi:uncharacterized protein YdiU (UPF0061 family)
MNDPLPRHLAPTSAPPAALPTALPTALRPLGELAFDNSFVSELPGDPELRNSPRPVRHACYTRVAPTPVAAPKLLAWSDATGALLGIARPSSPTGLEAEVLGGNRVLAGMQPYAARYGGHQFGHWAGQLGDGRAMTLAETLGPNGQRYELQLKGAGRTPYSRTADGRAVLRSSVREFLCSEAMHWLGVPTTRALSLVGTGDAVVRDMFYDGNPQAEPGAVVCRVAPSFVRFGNFEILAAHGELDNLRRLAGYVVRRHFADLPDAAAPTPDTFAAWFEEICRRTAVMASEWMRVGFVHGVMNTDNMSILGVTIDYGPYGWLEGYEPGWTPNTTDGEGRRYCYANQPGIAQWNLVRLANAILPLCNNKEDLERRLAVFTDTYEAASDRMLADKLGLTALGREGDDALTGDLFALLQAVETDMTLFFRQLSRVAVDAGGAAAPDRALVEPLRRAFYDETVLEGEHGAKLAAWLRRYATRVQADAMTMTMPPAGRVAQMHAANPKYVLRNYMAQQAIDALQQGDASVIERLMDVLQRPYDDQPQHDELAARRPEWARNKAGCSALSCSS